jgi:hypothetical protein
MRAFEYINDGEIIRMIDGFKVFSHLNKHIYNTEHVLIINCVTSFGLVLREIKNKDKLIEAIVKYQEEFGSVKKILFMINEILVQDETPILDFAKEVGIDCYYSNYDIQPNDSTIKLTHPESLYGQFDYLIVNDYLNAKKFLYNMNVNYEDFLKPYKYTFFSNHVSPIRIDIFNILKATDNLKNGMWSFNNSLVYYSDLKHNLDSFFKDNEGIIPKSYDNFNEKTVVLKDTYFSHFLSYYEIVSESYFFNDIPNIENHCPITEKLIKPIITHKPFILFGSNNTIKVFKKLGMTFNCPLYGFYDTTNENSTREGLGHVTQQTIMKIEDLHKIYYKHRSEFSKNCELFVNYLINNKENVLELFDKRQVII